MKEPKPRGDRGPGVPEAVPRSLQRLWDMVGPGAVDRIWVFPPMVSGRKESGLLAVGLYGPGDDPDRRVLAVLPYAAERTGTGVTLETSLLEHGEAPLDRLPRVMEGVVRRTETDLGEPREVEIGGSEERMLECLAEFDRGLLDPGLPPLRTAATPESSETAATPEFSETAATPEFPESAEPREANA